MKKWFVLLQFILLTVILSAQQATLTISEPGRYSVNIKDNGSVTDYLKKSKSQKKTAFIFLGAGVGLIATAFIIPQGELVKEGPGIDIYDTDKYENDGLKSAILISGLASSLVSIPFFIASKKNQKKGTSTSLILKLENAMPANSYLAAGIKIQLHN